MFSKIKINPTKKFAGIIVGVTLLPVLTIIAGWGVDVYITKMENKERTRSAIEMKLGPEIYDFRRSFPNTCSDENRTRFTLYSKSKPPEDVCIEFKDLGCRTIEYSECQHIYEVVELDKIVRD